MAKRGRPRALDDTKRGQVCALVSAGAGMRQAAEYVGCSHSTLCREARRDAGFREQLRRARATTQLAPLQSMRQAAQTNWRAAAWMLERSDPEHYGRNFRNTFGLKELRALARDLMTIFDEEIDQPVQRDRVSKRVQATINYAMSHAWDTRRTGKSLQKAMSYFANKETLPMPPSDFDFSLDSDDEMSDDESLAGPSFATLEGSHLAKLQQFCQTLNEKETRKPDENK